MWAGHLYKADGSSPYLKSAWLETPLGQMIVVADDNALYLLAFVGSKGLERALERLRQHTTAAIMSGTTPPILSIEQELKAYFAGTLKTFHTPLCSLGSPFQQAVWHTLCEIPYGETQSYLAQATTLGKPAAFRAVANANGANPFAILVPCHRVIHTSGTLGGYAAGLAHKKWLIQHEQQHKR